MTTLHFLRMGIGVRYNVHMKNTMTATEARKNFFAMLKKIETPGVSVVITHEGHPKGIFLSVDEYESLLETLDIMSDPDTVAALREAKRDKEKGDFITLDELRKKFGV